MANGAMSIEERFKEVKEEIATRSVQDSAYREKLLEDPQTTIEQEYGLEAGSLKDVNLRIIVESPGSVVIPVPPDFSEMQLTDEQLDQVAGGAAFIGIPNSISVITCYPQPTTPTSTGRSW